MKNLSRYLPSIGIINGVVLMIVSILKEVRILSPFHPFFQLLLFLGILIGGLSILANLVINRIGSKFELLCYGLVLTLSISSVLSPEWRSQSLKDAAATGICVLSIFIFVNGLSIEKKHLISYLVLRVLMIMTSIISVASILLFFISPFVSFEFLGREIELGMSTNRVYGFYQSLSLPIASASFVFGLIFRLNPNYKGSKFDQIVFYVNLISNFIFVSLSFAFGALIAIAAASTYFLFFMLVNNKKSIWVSVIVSISLSLLFLGGIYGTRTVLFAVQNSDFVGGIDDEDEPGLTEDVWKNKTGYGILTGRDTIWRFGFDKVQSRPLIGFGASAFYGTKVLGTQELQSFHNVFVQSIVSGGIIHSIFSFSVIGLIIVRSLKYCFQKVRDQYYMYNLSIISLLVFSVIGGLVETNFLYVNRFPMYIFWFSLGLLTFNITKPLKNQNMLKNTQ